MQILSQKRLFSFALSRDLWELKLLWPILLSIYYSIPYYSVGY
jgi:hypothetical protein